MRWHRSRCRMCKSWAMTACVLMGPGVYYFFGGTMSGKSTTIRDLLLQRNELIAFQHADAVIRRGGNEVIYFTGSDFDAMVHDPLDKSGVVFNTRFPMPNDLDALSKDRKPHVVVLHDWMNRIFEEPTNPSASGSRRLLLPHVGFIFSSDEMERLMRRAERAKQEFLRDQQQTGRKFTLLGLDVLSVDRQTRPNLEPARLDLPQLNPKVGSLHT